MTEDEKDLQQEASTPRPGFLVAAAVVSILAAMAYVYEDALIGENGATGFAVLLIFLVLMALFLVLCYRNPRMGNRLLGYDVAIASSKHKVKSDVQYSAGFKAETGLETKRMNSQRKQARHSRRKLAETTRTMQQDSTKQQAQKTENVGKSDE